MIDWNIEGQEMANCNCNFGCPCQFGVLPTGGTCEAVVVYDITKGHYGDTSLDGVRAASVYYWPGPIHEGNGQMQLIIDQAASDAQRAALEAIMTGQDTDEMASGTAKTNGGAIDLAFDATHAHFAKLNLTGQGVADAA